MIFVLKDHVRLIDLVYILHRFDSFRYIIFSLQAVTTTGVCHYALKMSSHQSQTSVQLKHKFEDSDISTAIGIASHTVN